jgi:hypothetical protein
MSRPQDQFASRFLDLSLRSHIATLMRLLPLEDIEEEECVEYYLIRAGDQGILLMQYVHLGRPGVKVSRFPKNWGQGPRSEFWK